MEKEITKIKIVPHVGNSYVVERSVEDLRERLEEMLDGVGWDKWRVRNLLGVEPEDNPYSEETEEEKYEEWFCERSKREEDALANLSKEELIRAVYYDANHAVEICD